MRNWNKRAWVICFALAAGPAFGLVWKIAPGAGGFQYYQPGGSLAAAYIGPVVNVAARAAWSGGALAFDGRWRSYRESDQDLVMEGGALFFFHPEPVRPYIGPVVGYGRPRRADVNNNGFVAGVRAGGLLSAADLPFAVDLYGGYRAQYFFGEDNRPNFYSELYVGGATDWMFSAHVGVRAAAEIGWPGYFALEHVGPAGPTVAPAFMVGPALAF